jgi:hypothetical protein
MSNEEPAAQDTAVQERGALGHETPPENAEWIEDRLASDQQELPRRPRRRLLAPVPLALLGVLMIAGGFIAGVLVQKGQSPSNSSGSGGAGLAARFAALRGGQASSSSGTTAAGGEAGGSGGGGAGRFGTSGAGGPTVGQVSYVHGSTLYVTNTQGNTVKVTTSAGASITKTVSTDVHGIHPGETVIVQGTQSPNGAISARSIAIGASDGGIGGLFGAGGRAGGSASGGGSATTGSGAGGGSATTGGGAGGGPALFGRG